MAHNDRAEAAPEVDATMPSSRRGILRCIGTEAPPEAPHPGTTEPKTEAAWLGGPENEAQAVSSRSRPSNARFLNTCGGHLRARVKDILRDDGSKVDEGKVGFLAHVRMGRLAGWRERPIVVGHDFPSESVRQARAVRKNEESRIGFSQIFNSFAPLFRLVTPSRLRCGAEQLVTMGRSSIVAVVCLATAGTRARVLPSAAMAAVALAVAVPTPAARLPRRRLERRPRLGAGALCCSAARALVFGTSRRSASAAATAARRRARGRQGGHGGTCLRPLGAGITPATSRARGPRGSRRGCARRSARERDRRQRGGRRAGVRFVASAAAGYRGRVRRGPRRDRDQRPRRAARARRPRAGARRSRAARARGRVAGAPRSSSCTSSAATSCRSRRGRRRTPRARCSGTRRRSTRSSSRRTTTCRACGATPCGTR